MCPNIQIVGCKIFKRGTSNKTLNFDETEGTPTFKWYFPSVSQYDISRRTNKFKTEIKEEVKANPVTRGLGVENK